jgi:virginiamycin B lyase
VLQNITLVVIASMLIVYSLGYLRSSNFVNDNYVDLKHRGDIILSTYATNKIRNESQLSNDYDKLSSVLREMGLLDSNATIVQTEFAKEYPMPPKSWPNGIMVDRNGTVWTVGTMSNTLISFDPKKERIKSIYPIPEEPLDDTGTESKNQPSRSIRMVWSIVEGKDGFIWFSQSGSLWRFDPLSGNFRSISEIRNAPFQMKVDNSTGNIWFTTFSGSTAGVIQKIDDTGEYKITEFNMENNETFPSGLFLQGDYVWITDTLQFDRIIKFKPIVDDNGTIIDIENVMQIPSSFPSASTSPSTLEKPSANKSIEQKDQLFNTPSDIVVFDNVSLWVTEHGPSFVTEFNLTSEQIKKYPTSGSFRHLTTLPYWISTGLNDNTSFWFNEHVGNRIAYFNITAMTLTEYEIPTRNATNGYIANALTLSVDPTDNNKVWFTEFNNDKIGVIDRSVPVQFNIRIPSNNLTLLVPEEVKVREAEGMDVQQVNQEQEQQRLLNQEIQNITIPITSKYNLSNYNDNNVNKYNDSGNKDKLLLLNASSSMSPSGKLVNMTATFVPSPIIQFSNAQSNNNKEVETNVELKLSSYLDTPKGNFTLGISATDGKVTKTDFVDIIVE